MFTQTEKDSKFYLQNRVFISTCKTQTLTSHFTQLLEAQFSSRLAQTTSCNYGIELIIAMCAHIFLTRLIGLAMEEL